MSKVTLEEKPNCMKIFLPLAIFSTSIKHVLSQYDQTVVNLNKLTNAKIRNEPPTRTTCKPEEGSKQLPDQQPLKAMPRSG